jgi:hypothetical protein
VGLVRSDISERRVESEFGVERIHELGTTLAVTDKTEPQCEEEYAREGSRRWIKEMQEEVRVSPLFLLLSHIVFLS